MARGSCPKLDVIAAEGPGCGLGQACRMGQPIAVMTQVMVSADGASGAALRNGSRLPLAIKLGGCR
jgi:hypothetical protein